MIRSNVAFEISISSNNAFLFIYGDLEISNKTDKAFLFIASFIASFIADLLTTEVLSGSHPNDDCGSGVTSDVRLYEWHPD